MYWIKIATTMFQLNVKCISAYGRRKPNPWKWLKTENTVLLRGTIQLLNIFVPVHSFHFVLSKKVNCEHETYDLKKGLVWCRVLVHEEIEYSNSRCFHGTTR